MKKLISILILSIFFANPVLAADKLATLFNPLTGQTKIARVGDRSAFAGGFILKTKIGGSSNSNVFTLLNGVSASTTSDTIEIAGASKLTLGLTVGNLAASGKATSTFTILVSVDGTNYATYNKLIDNVTNTNAQNLTRVGSKAIDSNTTSIISVDLSNDIFKNLKVVDTITGTTTSVVTVKALLGY
jgi:hypothetical protein